MSLRIVSEPLMWRRQNDLFRQLSHDQFSENHSNVSDAYKIVCFPRFHWKESVYKYWHCYNDRNERATCFGDFPQLLASSSGRFTYFKIIFVSSLAQFHFYSYINIEIFSTPNVHNYFYCAYNNKNFWNIYITNPVYYILLNNQSNEYICIFCTIYLYIIQCVLVPHKS